MENAGGLRVRGVCQDVLASFGFFTSFFTSLILSANDEFIFLEEKKMRKLNSICVAAMMLLVLSGSPVMALLVDPGFENNPLSTHTLVLGNFILDVWGVEAATIYTGTENGVTPAEGVDMLRMTDDLLVVTQAFQITDVSAYTALIDSGGATVNLNALFNVSSIVPAALGGVAVMFYDAGGDWENNIGVISGGITLNNLPGTWQTASVSGTIPVNTRWLISEVSYNNASLQSNPGYVDAVELTIVPEPTTMCLLALGGLLLRRRKHS